MVSRTYNGITLDFTEEEVVAMDRGYTYAERIRISGRQFGIYPQAISESHARKLDNTNGFRS